MTDVSGDRGLLAEGFAVGADCPHQCCSADGKYPHKHFKPVAECEGCQAIQRGRTIEELLEVAAAWFDETNGPDKAWWADYARLTTSKAGDAE